MTKATKRDEILKRLRNSITAQNFVKLTLSNYGGDEPDLKKITARPVEIKKQSMLGFTYTYKTRDIVKNYSVEEGLSYLEKFLGHDFSNAALFTTEGDVTYERLKNGKEVVKEKPPAQTEISTSHDHQKKRAIGGNARYLHDLGITDASGTVLKSAQDKYRQINRYVEILSPHLKNFAAKKEISAVDMGSGKGYLTFALYDYLANTLGIRAFVTGVEYRKDMVDLCNGIAKKCGFGGLRFVQGTIEDYKAESVDILVALHACDTATDDALYQGITARAGLIVAAPCCHKQIRREMEASKTHNDLETLTRHGIFMERQAEMVTDALRALLLEYAGYETKVFEFISSEHTAKNVLIIGEKNKKPGNPEILQKIESLKKYFGISIQHLQKKLAV